MSEDLKNAREVLSAYDQLVDDLRAENARLREALTDIGMTAGGEASRRARDALASVTAPTKSG